MQNTALRLRRLRSRPGNSWTSSNPTTVCRRFQPTFQSWMAPEKHKTLVFGASLVSHNTIDFYVSKDYFGEGICRPSDRELTPTPKDGEIVRLSFLGTFLLWDYDFLWILLFRSFWSLSTLSFTIWLQTLLFSCPSFFWALWTCGNPILVDAFYCLYELHCQSRKIFIDSEDLCEAQSGCCTFVPRRATRRLGWKGWTYHMPRRTSRKIIGYSTNFMRSFLFQIRRKLTEFIFHWLRVFWNLSTLISQVLIGIRPGLRLVLMPSRLLARPVGVEIWWSTWRRGFGHWPPPCFPSNRKGWSLPF